MSAILIIKLSGKSGCEDVDYQSHLGSISAVSYVANWTGKL